MNAQRSEAGSDKPKPQGQLTSPPSINLPKGGGAIRGIGEKFAANPVTGTGSMSIPVATSPGRSGFGPELSLSYDSGSGNGPFGFGWSLYLPSISRKTDKGLPRYIDGEDSDVFIRYTARHGGGQLKQQSIAELEEAVNAYPSDKGLDRLFSVRNEFANRWHNFFQPTGSRKDALTLDLDEKRFPYLLRGRKKTITQIEIFIAVNSEVDEPYTDNDLKLTLAQGDNPDRNKKVLSDLVSWKKMLHCETDNENGIDGELGNWSLTLTSTNLEKSINPKELDDVLLLCHLRFRILCLAFLHSDPFF